MKKALSILCMFVPMIASADYLDDQIASLTKQKQDKIAKLEECQKNTKGLKIAGITTLGVSAIGIGANIGEAVHLKKLDGKIAEAQDEKDDLAKQINAAKKTQNSGNKQDIVVNIQDSNNDGASMVANTCGAQNCVVSKESFLTSLAPGAVDAVCVNNLWYPSACKSGYRGVEKTCTLNNQIVNYVLSCVPGTLPEDKSGTSPEDESGTSPEDKSGTLPEDKSGKKQVPAQKVACERTVFSVAESESGQCWQMCSEYAKKNNCNLLGESVYIAISGECVCNPVPIDVRKASVKNSSEPVKIDCPDTELPNADLVRCNEKTGQLYIVTCKPGFKPILPLPDGGYMQCVKEEKPQPKQEETKEEDNSQKSVYETIKEENDALKEKIKDSDIPEEASILQNIVKQNDEFLDRTKEMIDANRDENGDIPAWDLVGGVIQGLEKTVVTEEKTVEPQKPVYETIKEENDALKEKIKDSDIPEEASILHNIVKENDEFLDRTKEMIDASRDDYGNVPAWNLVAGVVQPESSAPSVEKPEAKAEPKQTEKKKETAKPINDALKEQNKKMEEAVAKSGMPAEASIMQQIINQNNEFVARNNELINANKDANGNSPAWDLVAGVAQAQQQQPAAPMKGPYLLATPEKKQNTDASVSNKQSAGTATAPETPSGQPMYLNMLLGK